jgi:hypothetical protein
VKENADRTCNDASRAADDTRLGEEASSKQPIAVASKAVNKWKVFNDVGEAKDVFGLQDRSFTVLQALLSFYPSDELCG